MFDKIPNMKPLSQISKRTIFSHDSSAMPVDGTQKRVWKACERCRMKKTRCDGESPCQRCKNDGLICTVGSRKKTEFRQLPRGYAEVLENTQYALTATVQKLYTMVRKNESWELGDPDVNHRGQPVIHDIASRLGCVRPTPDLPYVFPESQEDFDELQAQLEAAQNELAFEDTGRRKYSEDLSSSTPVLDRTDRASSSESDSSALWNDQEALFLQQASVATNSQPFIAAGSKTSPVTSSIPFSLYTDFQGDLPMLYDNSPLWSADNEGFGQPDTLDLTAPYMRQQQFAGMPRFTPINESNEGQVNGFEANTLKAMQLSDGLNFANGTIRPSLLGYGTLDVVDPLDMMMFGGTFVGQRGMA